MILKKLLVTVSFLASFLGASAIAADSGLNPSSVLITIYGIAVSPNGDCSGATVVANYPSGQTFDFMQNPTILQGSITPNTYKCLIIKMSDVITFTSATTSTSGNCVAGRSVTRDVCRAGGNNYQPVTFNADNTVTIGSATACTGTQAVPANDSPGLFLSTTSTATSGNTAFLQPTTSANGMNLSSAFVVTGSNSGTFVVNFNGQVSDQGGACDVNAPVFSFR